MRVIKFYKVKEQFGCFSNFAAYPVELGGKVWPASEHYFQAQKFAGTKFEEEIRRAKDEVMRRAVLAKLTRHAELRDTLPATGDAMLVEHTRNESYRGAGVTGGGETCSARFSPGHTANA